MTGRDKILAALGPTGARENPAVICYSSIYYRDHWAQLTKQPWWALQSGDIDLHRAVWSDFIRNVGQDWFALPYGPSRADRENIVIEERANGVWRMDRRTGKERQLQPPRVGGQFIGRHQAETDQGPDTREEIDARLPLPDESAFARFQDGSTDLTEQLKAGAAKDLFWMSSAMSPLWATLNLWPFDRAMELLTDRPALVHYACERRLQSRNMVIEQAARLGARGVWIEECMTDMISPAAFREFNLPYLKRLVDAIRASGMRSIYYYCGNPGDRLDMLLDSGADALSLEESKKGWAVDIESIARKVDGRMTLLGNLDAIRLLERGSEEELRAEIGRQLAAGRINRNRFILSLGSPVTPGTSPERVRRYCEIAHEMGRTGG